MKLPQTCYVAIWKDRHADTTAHVFSDPDKAINWARSKCEEFDRFGDYKETKLNGDMETQGWIFDATYSCEGDGIRVVRTEVDQSKL